MQRAVAWADGEQEHRVLAGHERRLAGDEEADVADPSAELLENQPIGGRAVQPARDRDVDVRHDRSRRGVPPTVDRVDVGEHGQAGGRDRGEGLSGGRPAR